MGKKSQINIEKRKAIILCHKSGVSIGDISRQFDVSIASVYLMISKENQNSLEIKSRSGRPRCTTTYDDRLLIRTSIKNRFASANMIQNECSLNCSPRTIRRRLFHNGLKCYNPVRKPYITEKQAHDRLVWCKKYEKWTITDWEKV